MANGSLRHALQALLASALLTACVQLTAFDMPNGSVSRAAAVLLAVASMLAASVIWPTLSSSPSDFAANEPALLWRPFGLGMTLAIMCWWAPLIGQTAALLMSLIVFGLASWLTFSAAHTRGPSHHPIIPLASTLAGCTVGESVFLLHRGLAELLPNPTARAFIGILLALGLCLVAVTVCIGAEAFRRQANDSPVVDRGGRRLKELLATLDANAPMLSRRQSDALSASLLGMSQQEAADHAGMSVSSYRTHLTRGLNKLGIDVQALKEAGSSYDDGSVGADGIRCVEPTKRRLGAGLAAFSLSLAGILILVFAARILRAGTVVFGTFLAAITVIVVCVVLAWRAGGPAEKTNSIPLINHSKSRGVIVALWAGIISSAAQIVLAVDHASGLQGTCLAILLLLSSCCVTHLVLRRSDTHGPAAGPALQYIFLGFYDLVVGVPWILLAMPAGFAAGILAARTPLGTEVVTLLTCLVFSAQCCLVMMSASHNDALAHKKVDGPHKSSPDLEAWATGFGLSGNELQVVELISKGFTGDQIAGMMGYAKGSINSLRRSAYKKLGAHNVSELKAVIECAAQQCRSK